MEEKLRQQRDAVAEKQRELSRIQRKIENRLAQLHDAQTAALDEQGLTLMEYVKQTFSYQSDRVSKALAELTGREDDDA